MENKIVFIDIDGTLFDNKNDKIHQSTLEAIKQLKDNHIKVCIASGRSKVMSDEVFKRYHLTFDGYVLINGQYVILNDEVIYKNPLDEVFINEFILKCDKMDIPYGFQTFDDSFVSSHEIKVVDAFKNFKIKLPKIATYKDFNRELYQGLIFQNDVINYFSQKFKQYVKFIQWLEEGADIVPVNSSKANGLELLCEKFKIKRENVYAFGDSTNDIEMIKYAGVGIAMGNAKPALKEIADYITDDIDQDGLFNALKKFKLI
ncbi:MAG: Cof-type family hydrolase [Haloplasmataceae bacterium]|nr:Cof-type family hydrolase [Haloplasmataceae bacterium]